MSNVNDQGANKELLTAANRSGFSFQLRVKKEIENNFGNHGWRVVGEECRWRDRETKEEDFADLILETSPRFDVVLRILIEWKCFTGGKLIFYRDDHSEMLTSGQTEQAYIHLVSLANDKENSCRKTGHGIWQRRNVEPQSRWSCFCSGVLGDKSKSKRTLEPLCAPLIRCVESFGAEDLAVRAPNGSVGWVIYVPLIVTTADLLMCDYTREGIGLPDGQLSAKETHFTQERMVRFQKQLSTTIEPPKESKEGASDFIQANEANQRTVFIVRGTEIANVLRAFSIK